MKRKIVAIILMIGLSSMMLLGGCDGVNTLLLGPDAAAADAVEETFIPTTPPAPETEVVTYNGDYDAAYKDFSFELFKQCYTEGNTMLSPASVHFALGMALAGADGETATQMNNLLSERITTEENLVFSRNLANSLMNDTEESFHIANSLWTNEAVLPNGMLVDYTTVLTDYFNAECNTLPFNKEATDKINDWVSRNTMEMIPRIMEDINPDATAYLINAVAFEGKWEETFEKDMISESTFTSASGETQDVTMMTETLDGFYENNLATGFMKTYEGGKYAFLAMLPKKNGDLKTFVNSLNAENYQEFLDSRDESCQVHIEMPKFTYEYQTSLTSALQTMGMTDAFSDTADFTKMTGSTSLQISDVMQKTFIEVNEEGTRAAAVTSISLECTSATEERFESVILNRPFVYAIVDTESGLPIFIGTLNEITP
ncbi:MAG: serpin family protein [Lachnospiraceae bacterium]|nr:serpin family protein [Lachnospiraceae bacterium]